MNQHLQNILDAIRGLGLSLSNDVIKAHGGEIKVNTQEGEGSKFIIQFRIN